MAKSKEGLFSEAWKGVAGAASLAVFAWVMDWVKPVWEWLLAALKSCWSHLVTSSLIPNWVTYAMSLALAISALRWALRAWESRKDNHERFTQFNFMGGVWRWNFMSGAIWNLGVYCPTCDGVLVYEENTDQFFRTVVNWHCERCNSICVSCKGDKDYLNDRVKREIDRLIRTGEWRNYVDRT